MIILYHIHDDIIYVYVMRYLFTILPRHGTPVIGVCFADLKTTIKSKKTRTLWILYILYSSCYSKTFIITDKLPFDIDIVLQDAAD